MSLFDSPSSEERARIDAVLSRGFAEVDLDEAELGPEVDEFSFLTELEENWDGYHAEPIDPACTERARAFYAECPGRKPAIVPCVTGGVALEWFRESDGVDAVIAFEPDGDVGWLEGLSEEDLPVSEVRGPLLEALRRQRS